MNTNTLLIVGVLALLLWMATNERGLADSGQAPTMGCVEALQAQYSGQWAEMNKVERVVVGLRAASCEGGR